MPVEHERFPIFVVDRTVELLELDERCTLDDRLEAEE